MWNHGKRVKLELVRTSAEYISAMKQVELLKQMTFGMEVAEQETNELENYFVETDDWARSPAEKLILSVEKRGPGKAPFTRF